MKCPYQLTEEMHQESEELHSHLHHGEKKRKRKEADDGSDDGTPQLSFVEMKYRVLLVKKEMLLRQGAIVLFS